MTATRSPDLSPQGGEAVGHVADRLATSLQETCSPSLPLPLVVDDDRGSPRSCRAVSSNTAARLAALTILLLGHVPVDLVREGDSALSASFSSDSRATTCQRRCSRVALAGDHRHGRGALPGRAGLVLVPLVEQQVAEQVDVGAHVVAVAGDGLAQVLLAQGGVVSGQGSSK